MSMWKPTELGEVIAERTLALRRKGTRSKSVRLRIGRPVHAPRPKGDPWWCPVEITGLGRSRLFFSTAGEDSLQAFTCALQGVEGHFQRHNSRRGTPKVEWAGDTERPIFARTFFVEMYEHAINNLLAGVRFALLVIENPDLDRRAMAKELTRLLESRGFGRPGSTRRPARRAR
jgi:hypothetical protein